MSHTEITLGVHVVGAIARALGVTLYEDETDADVARKLDKAASERIESDTVERLKVPTVPPQAERGRCQRINAAGLQCALPNGHAGAHDGFPVGVPPQAPDSPDVQTVVGFILGALEALEGCSPQPQPELQAQALKAIDALQALAERPAVPPVLSFAGGTVELPKDAVPIDVAFTTELEALCVKYGVDFDHEDRQGCAYLTRSEHPACNVFVSGTIR